MNNFPNHAGNLVSLKRIEGQVRGIQRMIEKREYCVDILNQIHAIIAALARVEDRILEKHFEGCVANAMHGKSRVSRKQKLAEILELIGRFRKT